MNAILVTELEAELLAALKDTVRMLEAVRFTAGLGPRQMQRLEAARAVIAKATA